MNIILLEVWEKYVRPLYLFEKSISFFYTYNLYHVGYFSKINYVLYFRFQYLKMLFNAIFQDTQCVKFFFFIVKFFCEYIFL